MTITLTLLLLLDPLGNTAGSEACDPLHVEQVQVPADRTRSRTEQIDEAEGADVGVEQLPDTIELPRDATAPEDGLSQLAPEPPRVELYREVASAWEMIRRRGQQPTPELIAREIGPDLLARFLNQFPGSEGIFGADTDQLPISPPAPDHPVPGGDPQ